MKNIVHYNKLFDAYKNILKEEEKNIFYDYYEEDLSMQEIAENAGQLKDVAQILEDSMNEFQL